MRFMAGDILKRPGPWGTTHVGLYVGVDRAGLEWVIHNAKADCVRGDLLDDFGAGSPVSLHRRAMSPYEGAVIIARAESQLGRKFDLINFNCEHLVSYAWGSGSGSPQLLGFALGAAALACIGFLAR